MVTLVGVVVSTYSRPSLHYFPASLDALLLGN